MPGWVVNLVIVAGVIAAGLLAASVVDRLNDPSPFVISSVDPPRRTIRVDLQGAVVSPGVYTLPQGARLADLLDAAGGLNAEADPALINRATLLQDGQLVVVPVEGEPVASSARLVDLNTATAVELEELPQIGPVRARAIVVSRETSGPFSAIEDLVLRNVVSPALFEQIRHLIVVSK